MSYARVIHFNLPVDSYMVHQIDLEYHRRPPDCLYLHGVLSAEYLKFVDGLKSSTSLENVLEELRPLRRLCDL